MFKQWIDDHKDIIVSATQDLLRIPSVGTSTTDIAQPFGEETDRALQLMLRLGKQHGFNVRNVDGYAGHIEYGNLIDNEYVGVLTHLDVVPAGNGWTKPPFAAEIHNGKIFARGALDDKGPAMAAFYAMLAVKESGVPLNKNVRLIMGLDEESEWRCMDHYFQHEPVPWAGFTPDADFPLIFAEKGILHLELRKSGLQGLPPAVVQIVGGQRVNMVPDICTATLQIAEDLQLGFTDKLRVAAERVKADVRVESTGHGRVMLEVHGKAAHGSTPEFGVNAIQLMGALLVELFGPNPYLQLMSSVDIYGAVFGIDCEDSVSGRLSCNMGIAQIDSNGVRLVFDIRYPVDQTSEKLIQLIQRVANRLSCSIHMQSDKRPLHVPKDSELVKSLLSVYEETTGQKAEPLAIGGGTYARAISNCVAFGPLFPGAPDVAHQKDEYMEVEDLLQITELYAQAIYRLAK